MSRYGLGLFLAAGVAAAVVLITRYILGGWVDYLWIPLGIVIVAPIVALVIDIKFYLEFFTMRTTKHGMNMGTMILLAALGIGAINFIAVKKNKVLDITEDKLFSLSQQSVDVVKALNEDLGITIFYRGEKSRQELNQLRESLKLYEDISDKVKVQFYDSYKENRLAQEYLNSLADKSSPNAKLFVFAEYQGKRERVDAPFSESELTSAMVKVTRKVGKKVYFLTGHGERDLSSDGDDGLRAFKEELERFVAKTEPLNLLESAKLPDDAETIVIAGPTSPLMETELELLRDFARKGGRLLVMADPGEKHNLAQLLRTLGIEFANDYVLNGRVQVAGFGQETVLGLKFDQTSAITKGFMAGNSYALFHLASEVSRDPRNEGGLVYSDLVSTGDGSLSIKELSPNAQPGSMRSYVLAIGVKGKLKDKDGKEGEKEFLGVAFGDSDFATNKLFSLPVNRDLALNAVAYLNGEQDLISIRPKQPKGTKMTLTQTAKLGVVSAGVLMPLALLIMGSVVWFRRRGA